MMNKDVFKKVETQFLTLDWSNYLPGLVAGFTTKEGGRSSSHYNSLNLGLHVNDDTTTVAENRKLLAKLLDFPASQWACSDQVHDNRIEEVTKEEAGKGVFHYEESIKGTDGVYTKEANLLLTLCYADCVPLYFCAPSKKLIGMAHAGWKGTVKDIAGEMVRKWQEREYIHPSEVIAAIGPSIGDCCYVVDDHVIGFVEEKLDKTDIRPYQTVSPGQYSLNLKALNKKLMMKAGIQEENIHVSSYCTSCDSDLFFSHRRDKGQTGRMMSFMGRKE